jgi:NitT/TauT family transport system substrate-binding protein
MRNLFIYIIGVLLLAACGESYEEKRRITRAEQIRLAKADSAALKVGVTPTLDCMPVFLAKEHHLFDTLGVDIRPKLFTAHLDIQDRLEKGKLEAGFTDLVRAERMMKRGTPLYYVTATNTYWQFITNRKSRIKELRQLTDKMVAMTNHSVTDMLAQMCVDSVKLKQTDVFRVPINDVYVRLSMLQNNEMDAMLMTEPQATTARLYKNPVLMDTRKIDLRMGAIVMRERVMSDQNRKKQLDAFVKAYNMACDSLNMNGWERYKDIMMKYIQMDEKTYQALPKLKFEHAQTPRQKDIDRAKSFL